MFQSVLLSFLLLFALVTPYPESFLKGKQADPTETPVDWMGFYNLDTYDEDEEYGRKEEEDYEDEKIIEVILHFRNQSGNMTNVTTLKIQKHDYENSKLPQLEGVGGFPLKNFSCIVYNHRQLQCSWDAINLPSDAQSSLTVIQEGLNTKTWNCHPSSDSKLVACQGNINHKSLFMTVRVNVSLPDLWYIHTQHFDIKHIERLNPPQKITMSVNNAQLKIKWEPPASIADLCFLYQININNDTEVIETIAQREYTLPGVDLKTKYSVRMRVTKTAHCVRNHMWSDWTEVLVLYPSEAAYEINIGLLVVITMCIPMLVLPILLLCKFRIHEKLFPPVPEPSQKIKTLLEKDIFLQGNKFPLSGRTDVMASQWSKF